MPRLLTDITPLRQSPPFRRLLLGSLLSSEVLGMLKEHDWSGNVRELANVMERAFILAGGGPITPAHLQLVRRSGTASSSGPAAQDDDTPRTLEEIEMAHLLRVLEKHRGSKTAAAAELGISLKTLHNELNPARDDENAMTT